MIINNNNNLSTKGTSLVFGLIAYSDPWQHAIYMLKDNGLILATEDMRRTRPIIFRSMSSSVLPCVSGT